MKLDKATKNKLSHIDIDPTWATLAEEGARKVTADMRRLARSGKAGVAKVKGELYIVPKGPRLFKCVRNDGGYWVVCFESPDIEMCRRMLKLNPEWRKSW
jgi:hypothetical protein